MSYQDTYQYWRQSPSLSPAEREELAALASDDSAIKSRFFSSLEFGTAGLRGTMGVGLACMNIHVVRHATQAFAEVILAEGAQAASQGIAICFDCRNHSAEFAREATCVMAGNGIPVRLFDSLRPTPELSFAIREYGCIAGINITASHNPKEYNGYKVYWSDGAQLPPHHAAAIAEKMETLDVFTSVRRMDYQQAVQAGLVSLMGEETDEAFLSHVMAQVNDKAAVEAVADSFRMVYTPFHGTGYRLIPEALRRLGMKHVVCVPEQMVLDGNFPTVASPNPENPESFALAIALATQVGADFILGSDPDADRVGIMVRNRQGDYVAISGNQTGVLLLDYLIGAKKRAGTLPPKPVALKTIVTTEMARKAAEENGVACFDTFTGFKFMAEKKNQLEAAGEGQVIFSYEESYGYMLGDYVRDKDAVTASLILTEMAAWYAGRGMTLYDALEALFETYGFYDEKTVNLVMPGLEGMEHMKRLMADLRAAPPSIIAETPVLTRADYSTGLQTDLYSGAETAMELSGSNVLRYQLEDGSVLLVRPSGTEPKLKVYILAQGRSKEDCASKITRYSAWANTLPPKQHL
ncbi:MAG: Phosphoglucosamine mutase [Oscillospiraceae bacterium]|nr:Phosphoglucosamine mutase [Oscillospiraceae bacterium]